MVTRTTLDAPESPVAPVAAGRRCVLGLPAALLCGLLLLLTALLAAAGCSRRPTEAAGPAAQPSDSATISVQSPPAPSPPPAALPGRAAGDVRGGLGRQAGP